LEECRKLKIDESGNKGALIERIKETWILKGLLNKTDKSEDSENNLNELSNEDKVAATQVSKSDDEDGPIEDWTKQELLEECRRLKLDESGNKVVLIDRIKETWISRGLSKETDESEDSKNKHNEGSKQDQVEATLVTKSEDEDGPIEDWTKQELLEECRKLKIDGSGNKCALIDIIKETWISRGLNDPVKTNGSENKQNEGSNQDHAEATQVNKSDDEDGPIENWTKQELLEECRNLKIDESGNKGVLIDRIKETWISRGISKETDKSNDSENKQNESSKKDQVEASQVTKSDDEDGPIENWTKQELLEECRNLKIDESGNKGVLIDRIKETWISRGTLKADLIPKCDENNQNDDSEDVIPLDDWSKKELIEECRQLEIDTSGNKGLLITKIQEAWQMNGRATKTKDQLNKTEVEANVVSNNSDDEDGPLEDWSKKELIEECITIGVDSNGNKDILIQRIRAVWLESGRVGLGKSCSVQSSQIEDSGMPLEVGSTVNKKARYDAASNVFKTNPVTSLSRDNVDNIDLLSQEALVTKCKEMGLPSHGNISTLLQRLKESVKENDEKKQIFSPKRKSDNYNLIDSNKMTPQEKRRKRVNYLEMHTGKISPPGVERDRSVTDISELEGDQSVPNLMSIIESADNKTEESVSPRSVFKTQQLTGNQNASKKVLKKYRHQVSGIVKRLDVAPILSSRHKRRGRNESTDSLRKVMKNKNKPLKNKMDILESKKKISADQREDNKLSNTSSSSNYEKNDLSEKVKGKSDEGKLKYENINVPKQLVLEFASQVKKSPITKVIEKVKHKETNSPKLNKIIKLEPKKDDNEELSKKKKRDKSIEGVPHKETNSPKLNKIIKLDPKKDDNEELSKKKKRDKSIEGIPASKKAKKSEDTNSGSKEDNKSVSKPADKVLETSKKSVTNVKSSVVTSKKHGLKKFDLKNKTKENLNLKSKESTKAKDEQVKNSQSDKEKKHKANIKPTPQVNKQTVKMKSVKEEPAKNKVKPASLSSKKRKSTDSQKSLKAKKIKKN